MIYLDHNASSPLSPAARTAWLEAVDQFPANPSSQHRMGARAARALEHARERLAILLGCAPQEIVWTSGATESNNLLIHHFTRELQADQEIWISAVEHPSLASPASRDGGQRVRRIPVTSQGEVDLDWLSDQLVERRPGLIAVMAANNETGVLQPWREVRNICRRYEIPLACDAAQWLGRMPARGLGTCDFLSGCAHKFGGPRGIGFLKVPSSHPLQPAIVGGPQEEGRRAGTENLPGILAFLAALENREDQLHRQQQEIREEGRKEFEQQLREAMPSATIVGGNAPRLWNTVMVLMPPADCRHRWVVKLDKLGCQVSTGTACSSGTEKSSPVLEAMGYTTEESSRALRFSSGWETPVEDWLKLLTSLKLVHSEMLLDSNGASA